MPVSARRGVPCPTCDGATTVFQTKEGVRKRECENGHRFETAEQVVRMLSNAREESPRWLGAKTRPLVADAAPLLNAWGQPIKRSGG